MPETVTEEREGRASQLSRIMPGTVMEERVVYLVSRKREVRCHLWFQVTPFREGLFRFFLIGMEELE